MKEFYFIRHAKTKYNLENRYTGSHDISIIKEQYLPDLSIDSGIAIISSPMLRALQTIELMSLDNKTEIYIFDSLKERDFGIMNGKKKPSYAKRFFYKGETYYQFRKRVLQEFQYITKKYDKFVIVSHSGVYKVLYEYLKEGNPHLKPTINNLELVKFRMNRTYEK